MNALVQDFKFAIRALAQRPVYAMITILVLALAIGANATVFSVFNGFFLRPLPYPNDSNMVLVYNTYPKMNLEVAHSSIPDYLDRKEQAPSLESLALFNNVQRTLGVGDRPEQVTLVRATPSLFEVYGVAPLHGRVFAEDEAVIGNDRFLVLNHEAWVKRFGGNPEILGTEIRLDGEPFTVLGVMPERLGNPATIGWVPFAFTPQQMSDEERGREYSVSIGRLAPGATVEGLSAELDVIVQRNLDRLDSAFPQARAFVESSGFTGKARDLREYMVGDMTRMLLTLQAVVAAVLLIACANVANLQLARTLARRKELSVRAVLGAGRGQLARLVLFESLLLAALGAVAGIAIAYGGLELVRVLGLDRANQGFEFALDARVLAVTAGAALLAALVSGLLPVIALWRENHAQTIHEAGRMGAGMARSGMRNALVVLQVAVSVALLVGAGLLTKSFYHLQQEGGGFESEGVLTARVTLPQNAYPDEESRREFYTEALDEFAALPGVTAAAYTTVLPFSGNNSQGNFVVDGYMPEDGEPSPHAQNRNINEQYFPALDIPVIQGRNFNAAEPDRVAIIDVNVARKYFPNGDAIGNRIRRNGEEVWYAIVGIVPAVKHGSLTDEATKETIYWHYLQRSYDFGFFVLKTAVPPEQLTGQMADTISRIDPGLPLYDIKPLAVRVEDSLGPQRTPMVLTMVFAGVAITLAVIGIYGVLTWAVTQRFGEIGVRMALGARSADIVGMVVKQGGRLTLIGLMVGLAGAFALARMMASQLYGVSAFDPQVFALVLLGLAAAAGVASWIPARRAAGITPMAALREE